MSDVTMTYNKTSSDSCELEFKSEVEGIATTYGNLYRRVLLQSTPCFSVAGLRCRYNGKCAKNFFEIIPGMTTSLINVNTALFNAVFDVDCEDDYVILSVDLENTVKLSDICNMDKVIIRNNTDDIKILLKSQDTTLTTVVGSNNITLDIFLRRGVGFSNRDVNIEALKTIVGEDEAKTWIVSDSQHRGVVSTSYHNEVRLGKQTVKLEVKSHQNNIDEVIHGCTETIIAQLREFQEMI